MKTATLLLSVWFVLASDASGQTSRRRGTGRPATPKPPVAQPLAESQPTPVAPVPREPVLLAVVNGQNVTTADLEASVREEVEALDNRIADARNQILEVEINTLLLANEAKKRKISPQQLYDTEVARKIANPSQAEVARFIEENRDELSSSDPATMREQVVDYLRSEREAQLSAAFVKKLRATNPVTKVAANLPNLPPATVLATVGGQPVLAGNITERLKPIIYKLRMNAYLTQQPAVERTINDILLLAEANRQQLGPEEIVRHEISEKVKPPTEEEVLKFYNENKSRLNGTLDALRNQIATYLQDQNRERLEREFAQRLRKGANVRVLITEPEPPVQSISLDDDPVKGEASAPVTIVEFTDFQCPSCGAMHPVIEEALKSYGNKVRLVVRDFPLQMHANARKAAEAANAANAQGKFFEYTALLFKRQNALDVPSLKKYATEIGLNRALFDAALDSGKYAAEVRHDIADGQIYGVEGTPTIFVNGVMLRGLSNEALKAAIDRSLASGAAPAQ